MKKNKKSVPTEKKFWIISIAVGICLVVLSVCFFSNADKEKKEANLLDTVNYVKVLMFHNIHIIMNHQNPKVCFVPLREPGRSAKI